MHRSRTAGTAIASLALLASGGCGSSHGGSFGPDGGAADAGPTIDSSAPPIDAPSFGDASFTGDDGGIGDEVFVESPDTLYRLDPNTKAVSVVGPFSGCSQVTDIALDQNSNMYATTLDGFYAVDRTSAACTRIAAGTYPNSLSFVPAGTLDPNVEALVGYLADTYVRIDLQSGAITSFASIGQGYTSSGDLVSVKGGGTYVAVKGGPDSCSDCLIQVDPATGQFLMEWGAVNHTGVFGLAFWAGAVYGADDQGELFEIDFHGLAMQFTAIPVPNAPAGLQFWGAGTTTVAPLTPR